MIENSNDLNLILSDKVLPKKSLKKLNFVRLFLATCVINKRDYIDRYNLKYDLYQFLDIEKYKLLFEGIPVKEENDKKYLDIETELKGVVFYKILSPNDADLKKRKILISPQEALDMVKESDIAILMDSLVEDFIKYVDLKDLKNLTSDGKKMSKNLDKYLVKRKIS